MTTVTALPIGSDQPRSGTAHFAAAILVALLIEGAGIGAMLVAANRAPAPPRAPGRMRIAMHELAEPPPVPVPPLPPMPAPPVPAAPPLPVPVPVPEAAPLPPTPVPDLAAPHLARHMQRSSPPTATSIPRHQPTPVPPVPRAPAPAPPPAAAAPSAAMSASFEAALRAAVQASLIYPAGAQAAHENGVARVRFSYLDGRIGDIVIETSTGFPVLDQAARQTVRDATYPATPRDFAGHRLALEVLVVFRAADSDMESD
ncbi:TonB family protein [Lichenicoccus sp.]|uniref:TonB family protein n=1 Tax=Lichenicoccus sp. TaxID=2781899 RepID=UPI003D13BDD9